MLFHSLEFAIFLPLVLVLDWLLRRFVPSSWTARKTLLLVASYAFYMSWRWEYAGLLVLSTVVDFAVGRGLTRTSAPARRRALLLLSLCTNLGILGLFKYYTFFVDSLRAVEPLRPVADALPVSDLLLPVGISFYTFQTLSYTIDVYRGRLEAQRNLLDFGLYVAFFPQLVAGPIVRARDFLWQLHSAPSGSVARLVAGLERFGVGLFKKAVIADNLVLFTDPVFADPSAHDPLHNLAAISLWSLVIYFDFSGYSDMAIGVARMLGFRFMENFHFPYLARSVTDFWRRWHISLSSWLRDYLYIPLGGSRHGLPRTMVSLAVTMLLGGLWHGASWNFVLWGAWWGAWLCIAHLWRHVSRGRWRVPLALSWSLTLLIAVLGWVPFRCVGFDATWAMLGQLGQLLTVDGWATQGISVPIGPAAARVVAALALLVVVVHAWSAWSGTSRFPSERSGRVGPVLLRRWAASSRPVLRALVISALFIAFFLLRPGASNAFIYFQF